MKTYLKVAGLFFFSVISSQLFAQSVLISEDLTQTAEPSSILDVKSNNKGILVPRMTVAERDAINQPASGLLIYCTDDSKFYFYANAQWNPIEGQSISGFTVQDDGNQKQSITSNGLNTSFINTNGSVYMNYDSNNDGSSDVFSIGRDAYGENSNYDFKIDEGIKLLSDKPLVYDNGVAQNLLSEYLRLDGGVYDASKYIAVHTNIPFQMDAMMSSIKMSYWSYDNNYEVSIGWYTYTIQGQLSFYKPNAYIAGYAVNDISQNDIVLANTNGKVTIYIPHNFFQSFGNLSFSSSTPAIFLTDDWFKGWYVEEDIQTLQGANHTSVDVKSIAAENFATTDLNLLGDRNHDLGGNTLALNNGNVTVNGAVGGSPHKFFVYGDSDDGGAIYGYQTTGSGSVYGVLGQANSSQADRMIGVRGKGGNANGTYSVGGAFQAVNSTNTTHLLLGDPSTNFTGDYNLYAGHDLPSFFGGNVGIGTSIPKEKLHIRRGNLRIDRDGGCCDPYIQIVPDSGEPDSWMMGIDDSGNKLTFSYGLQGIAGVSGTPFGTGADKFTIIPNGNVGIGTTNPLEKLHVKGNGLFESGNSGFFPALKIDLESDDNGVSIEAFRSDDPNNVGRYIALNPQGGNVGIGTSIPETKLDVRGRITLSQTSNEWIQSDGSIRIDIDNDNNQTDRAFIISAHNSANELLVIKENGNLAIGSSEAPEKLTLNGNIFMDQSQAIYWGNISSNLKKSYIGFTGSDNSLSLRIADNPGAKLRILGTGGQDKVVVTNDGLMGVGEDNPQEKLDVNGSVNISEALILEPLSTPPSSPKIGEMYLHDNGNSSYTLKIWLGSWKTVEIN